MNNRLKIYIFDNLIMIRISMTQVLHYINVYDLMSIFNRICFVVESPTVLIR